MVSPEQRELLAQLRTRLTERRDRAARRSQFLDSLEQEAKDSSLDEILREDPGDVLPPTAAAPDQDDVWNIRPENVALLQAAYPRALVHRFLDGIVRERVAALGRVRARRYCENHVQVTSLSLRMTSRVASDGSAAPNVTRRLGVPGSGGRRRRGHAALQGRLRSVGGRPQDVRGPL